MIKLVHIITDLDTGGAETVLRKILGERDTKRFEVEVISLTSLGVVGEQIQRLGIPVRHLGMRSSPADTAAVARLVFWLRHSRPDIVQTWMYHADLLGGASARLAGVGKIVWNIRHGKLFDGESKQRTRRVAEACALISPWLPARIVCCSEEAARTHRALGYASDKMIVIPNGFDLGVFQPDPLARADVRRELDIPDDAPVVGLVARFHPNKDHHNFVQAANYLSARIPNIHYLLCGEGVTWDNRDLASWIRAGSRAENWHLLGLRSDVPRLTAAIDVAVLSSATGEGFPNVVGEAMAAGVPVVATDVGDSSLIVGDTGFVVHEKDPEALAGACARLIEMSLVDRNRLGMAARERIHSHFALPSIVERYERLYLELLS